MKRQILFLLLLSTFISNGQNNSDDFSVLIKSHELQFINIKSISELAKISSQITTDKKEQLNILLYWTFYNMNGDENRFLYGNDQITTEEAIKKGKGLCEDYTNIFNLFCKQLNIESLRVDGYVKPYNFKTNDILDQANHTWNVVKIDSKWYLCDLFWATSFLNSENKFENKLFKKYYLSNGENFINDHLPCDPIFQLLKNPIRVEAFTNLTEGFNEEFNRHDNIDFEIEIEKILKIKKRELGLQIARNSYKFNKENPNILIEELYNYAVSIFNDSNGKKEELIKAKKYFSEALLLIDLSKKEHIISLKQNCQNGIKIINNRI